MIKSQPKYPFQAKVNRFVAPLEQPGMFVFYGGGKTYMTLKWFADRHTSCAPFPALVTCMKSNIDHWVNQVAEHSNFTCIGVQGTAKQRISALKTDVDIYIVNHDIVRSKLIYNYFRWKADNFPYRTIVVDESTAFKEARTGRFKKWMIVSKNILNRIILTGRPIMEEGKDIFAQLLFLDQGETFSRSFWKFRNHFFFPGPPERPYDWYLKPGAAEEIARLCSKKCVFVTKDEIADQLPPKVFNTVFFTMNPSVRHLYEELKEEFRVTLASGVQIDTQWAMVQSTKLHQMAQGFVYTDSTIGEYEVLDNSKLLWLLENVPLMLETGPVLIWSSFKAMFKRITEAFYDNKIPFACAGGGQKDAERQNAINAFKKGKTDVLLLSQNSEARGHDLWRANQAIFCDSSFKAELRYNAEDRCHRSGSEIHDKVMYYDLLTKNSVDMTVRRALRHKAKIADEILKHLKGLVD